MVLVAGVLQLAGLNARIHKSGYFGHDNHTTLWELVSQDIYAKLTNTF
jgi:hypothetical protein